MVETKPFQIRVNGEVVKEIDDHRTVERVHVFTSNGEAAAPAIAFDQDSIDIQIDYRSRLDGELQASDARLEADLPEEVLQYNMNAHRLEGEDIPETLMDAPVDEDEVPEAEDVRPVADSGDTSALAENSEDKNESGNVAGSGDSGSDSGDLGFGSSAVNEGDKPFSYPQES